MKGEIDLLGPATAVGKELMGIPDFGENDTSTFGGAKKCVSNFKKALLMVAGYAVQKIGDKLAKEQEIVMNIADIINTIYITESTLLRVEKMAQLKGEENCKEQIAMMSVLIYDSCDIINKAGKDAVNTFSSGDELKMMLMGIKRFTKHEPFNPKDARQLIALKLIDKNEYCY